MAGYGVVLQGRGVSIVTPLQLTQSRRASVYAAGWLATLAALHAIATRLASDSMMQHRLRDKSLNLLIQISRIVEEA